MGMAADAPPRVAAAGDGTAGGGELKITVFVMTSGKSPPKDLPKELDMTITPGDDATMRSVADAITAGIREECGYRVFGERILNASTTNANA